MCVLKYLKRKCPQQIDEEISLYGIRKVKKNKITMQGCNYVASKGSLLLTDHKLYPQTVGMQHIPACMFSLAVTWESL
jgi:hypothetical protein